MFKSFLASPERVRLAHFGGAFRSVRDAAREVGAACAINFGFFAPSPTKPTPVGEVMLDGVRHLTPNAECAHFHGVYRQDGAVRLAQYLPAGCEWGVRAGPRLLDSGKVPESSISDVAWERGGISPRKRLPRVAAGVRGDGTVLLAYSDGATIREMAHYMLAQGCVDALAGDGGGSASWYTPKESYGTRAVPNMIYVVGPANLPRVDLDLNLGRKLTANFTLSEFACACCGAVSISPRFADLVARLQFMRTLAGRPLHVTSGYRCAKHDRDVGTSSAPGFGPHTTGGAADVWIEGLTVDQTAGLAERAGFTGIGKYPNMRFVHVDMLGRAFTDERQA